MSSALTCAECTTPVLWVSSPWLFFLHFNIVKHLRFIHSSTTGKSWCFPKQQMFNFHMNQSCRRESDALKATVLKKVNILYCFDEDTTNNLLEMASSESHPHFRVKTSSSDVKSALKAGGWSRAGTNMRAPVFSGLILLFTSINIVDLWNDFQPDEVESKR